MLTIALILASFPPSDPGIFDTGAMVLRAVTMFICFFASKCKSEVLCDMEHNASRAGAYVRDSDAMNLVFESQAIRETHDLFLNGLPSCISPATHDDHHFILQRHQCLRVSLQTAMGLVGPTNRAPGPGETEFPGILLGIWRPVYALSCFPLPAC